MHLKDIKENTVIICKCGAVFGSKSEAIKHAKTHTKKVNN